jgi:hypothetical protein
MRRPVPCTPLVQPFADRLLANDLPHLDDERRAEVTAFTLRRIDSMPSVVRAGVLAIAAPLRLALALPLRDRVVRFLGAHPLPVAGEYVRLLRSLGYAYVWETWPDTRADGGPG